MKISNETKIGVLTAVAIALLMLGFNFLKGKNLFKSGTFIYARYPEIKKLMPSNPVFLNGFQIGTVYEIEAGDSRLNSILVSIKLKDEYQIPDNSIAEIASNPLGSPSIEIIQGNSSAFLKKDDTIKTRNSGNILGDLSNKLAPVADQLTSTLSSLDSVLKNFNSILDPNTKSNLQSVMANLNRATGNILVSTTSLQQMLNQQSGALARSLANMDSFSTNLVSNNGKLNNTISNIEQTTQKLANADINGAINNLKNSIGGLDTVMNRINSTEGTLGSLINDKNLYYTIQNTVRSLNTLADDLRVHPKRYVNISVFGKKDKGNYLETPLPVEDTLSPPLNQ